MRLGALVCAVVLLALPLTAACVDEDFADAQFLCSPSGGADECPPDMKCEPDGRCRRSDSSSDACTPRSCDQALPSCGTLDDGCGGLIDCGCWPPLSCGGAGIAGKCGCLPSGTLERSAGAFWSDATIGTIGWTEPASASQSDDQRASAEVTDGAITHYLKAADFGFDLPSTAIVNGIELLIERSAGDSAATLSDHEVRVAIDGELLPKLDKHPDPWASEEAITTYGGASELWESVETVTPALVNKSNFGMALSVSSTGGAATALVDSIRLKVHFDNPTCPGAGRR